MAGKQKVALGKGLASLIGTSGMESAFGLPGSGGDDESRVLNVQIDSIIPSPFQPRLSFTSEPLDELVSSIREHGIIQPLIVRKIQGNQYELIAGERRLRASKELKLQEVPIIVRKASDKEVLEWALVENLQREGLNPIEEAHGYARLAREFNLRQDQIAARVGKSRPSVANAIRLLDLHDDVQIMLAQEKISVGHAKAILSVKKKDHQLLLAQEIVRKSMNVRQAERSAKQPQTFLKTEKGPDKVDKVEKPTATEVIDSALSKIFNTKVNASFSTPNKKGKLEVHFSNKEELVRILELLGIDPDEASSMIQG